MAHAEDQGAGQDQRREQPRRADPDGGHQYPVRGGDRGLHGIEQGEDERVLDVLQIVDQQGRRLEPLVRVHHADILARHQRQREAAHPVDLGGRVALHHAVEEIAVLGRDRVAEHPGHQRLHGGRAPEGGQRPCIELPGGKPRSTGGALQAHVFLGDEQVVIAHQAAGDLRLGGDAGQNADRGDDVVDHAGIVGLHGPRVRAACIDGGALTRQGVNRCHRRIESFEKGRGRRGAVDAVALVGEVGDLDVGILALVAQVFGKGIAAIGKEADRGAALALQLMGRIAQFGDQRDLLGQRRGGLPGLIVLP